MPTFEVFTARTTVRSTEPLVTVHKRGTISLNSSAWSAIGEPTAVELLYDPEHRVIGLRPAGPDAEHAYPVRSSSGTGRPPYLVSAIAFTKFYKISTEHSLRWHATVEQNVLCVQLNSPATMVTSNRAGSRARLGRSEL